jgi:hypothetical protein
MNPACRAVQSIVTVLVVLLVGGSAPSAYSQAGVPVPQDSALYKAFSQLKSQSSYRVTMNMQVNDPRMAQIAAMGMGISPTEKTVQGNTTQVVMHMKLPAFDMRGMDKGGATEDWEIRAVVKDGRGARLITSAAAPRLLKMSDQMIAMQLAMLEKQAGTALAHAFAEGPIGMVSAAFSGLNMARGLASAANVAKTSRDLLTWQCVEGAGQTGSKTTSGLTDLRAVGDQSVNGTAATAYEFYVQQNGTSQGPVRLLVAKDTSLPLRIEMNDPGGRGSVQMNYTDFGSPVQIEIPACLGK